MATAPTGRELEDLLAPLPARAFVDEHWQKRPLHLRGRPDKLAHFGVDRTVLRGITQARTKSDEPGDLKAQYFDPNGHHREMLIEPAQVGPLFDAGMTICVSRLDLHVPALERLCAGVKQALGLGGSLWVNCYHSPEKAGFGLHFDNQSVFILQLEGKKRWRYSAVPAVDAPAQNLIALPDDVARFRAENPSVPLEIPSEEMLLDETLEPGDVLYLPPGTWHRTYAEGSSLALTLTAGTRSFRDVFAHWLRQRFIGAPDWRRDVPPALVADVPAEGLPERVEGFFAARLAELREAVTALEPRELADAWLRHVRVWSVPTPASAQGTVATVEQGTRLRLPWPLTFTTVPGVAGEERLHVYTFGHKGLSLPVETRDFLLHLARQTSFTAEEALGWHEEGYEWDEVREALEVLVKEGLLVRE